MELHHISQRAKGGKDTLENCIPLCFNCHAEVGNYNTEHPKGRKFSPAELKKHRDAWFAQVKSLNEDADSSQGDITVTGSANMVAGRDLTVAQKITKKNEVVPDAGGRHITDQEAYKVKNEIKKYSDLMKEAGLDPNPSKVWSRLYNHFQIPSYREIPSGYAEEAIKIIQTERAKARPKVRRRNPAAWRKQYYTAIWAASKQLGMNKEEVYQFANEQLMPKKQIDSLKKLTQKQLQDLDRKLKARLK
ncbi:HNH endonuclease [Desulfobulbus sp. TB]|nr:HNH endonuclease [Desulfobulbus sp. TB]